MKTLLRSLQDLSGLSDQEIDLLARAAQERHFRPGERIILKDEPGSSAYILKDGTAEAIIEKRDAEPIRLSTIHAGEMFGELALFDDAPRSATVVATIDCDVIEIHRDAFVQEIAQNPATALKLLSLLAQRLRRAEGVISDFSDRIYGDVLPRLQEAVSAQLDSAKIICEESRKRAESTIEHARRLQETTDQHWTTLSRIGTVVGMLVLAGGALTAFLGLDRVEFVAQQAVDEAVKPLAGFVDQIKQSKAAYEELQTKTEKFFGDARKKLERDVKDLEVMRQTALELDKMRRDLQLDSGPYASLPKRVTGEMARDFAAARRNLIDQYFKQPTRWEPEILIEALDLLKEALDRRFMTLKQEEWAYVVDTVIQALRNPPDHWRLRLKLREVTEKLYAAMVASGYQRGVRDMIDRMQAQLEEGELGAQASSLTATILARFRFDSKPVRVELRALQQSGSRWRSSGAAVDLVALGENSAWSTLRTTLAGQFVTGSTDESEEARERRVGAAFPAGHQIAERATQGDPGDRRGFSIEILDRQLSVDRLAAHLDPWPKDAPVGADLVGYTIFQGLIRDPDSSNLFFWEYSCDLVCDLGCSAHDDAGGGRWCAPCLQGLKDQYMRGTQTPARLNRPCGEAR
ncbi:MAG: cyclic nucleotide-binding domain-containing protein [Gammaproteobacteria bacterium]